MLILDAAVAASNAVALPWGDFVNSILENVVKPTVEIAAPIIITWVGVKLGGTATKVLQSVHADRMITTAADQALATVEGAEKGKTLSVNIANNVIRAAAQWLVDNAPTEFARVEKQVGSLIVAKLTVEATSKASDLDLNPTVVKPVVNAQATKDVD